MRILVAGNNADFAKEARVALRCESLVVEVAEGVEELIRRAEAVPYDVLVVDLELAEAGELDLIKNLRRNHVTEPILALLGDTALEARINALRVGADDCLVKPVLLAELRARVHALAKRAARRAGDCLEIEDLVLHCGKRVAFRAGRALPLTDREFTALECLVRARGRPVATAELLELMWHEKESPQDNFIAVLMMRLRKKVDEGAKVKLVRTIRGSGYAVNAFGV